MCSILGCHFGDQYTTVLFYTAGHRFVHVLVSESLFDGRNQAFFCQGFEIEHNTKTIFLSSPHVGHLIHAQWGSNKRHIVVKCFLSGQKSPMGDKNLQVRMSKQVVLWKPIAETGSLVFRFQVPRTT